MFETSLYGQLGLKDQLPAVPLASKLSRYEYYDSSLEYGYPDAKKGEMKRR